MKLAVLLSSLLFISTNVESLTYPNAPSVGFIDFSYFDEKQ